VTRATGEPESLIHPTAPEFAAFLSASNHRSLPSLRRTRLHSNMGDLGQVASEVLGGVSVVAGARVTHWMRIRHGASVTEAMELVEVELRGSVNRRVAYVASSDGRAV
jgi:hypothetical protein